MLKDLLAFDMGTSEASDSVPREHTHLSQHLMVLFHTLLKFHLKQRIVHHPCRLLSHSADSSRKLLRDDPEFVLDNMGMVDTENLD